MLIDAAKYDFRELNEKIHEADGDVIINNCNGQRFIGSGLEKIKITINGTPGNALGAYLDGAEITVNANAQDAVGDTMNTGKIVVHGNIGDAVGYAMRGGEIYIKGDAGYRAGIHMKEYKDKSPVMVIGGKCGSFLGEYQAGGKIIVLGLRYDSQTVGYFCGTGMHGGKIYLRGNNENIKLPRQVSINPASKSDMKEISRYIDEFCKLFNEDKQEILSEKFYVITPDSSNPYKQMYVEN